MERPVKSRPLYSRFRLTKEREQAMSREPTKAAQAAKLIRQALTAQGLVVRVKSRNFSMGDAVDVHMTDQWPEIAKLVRAYCGRFQYGSFNAMEDMYEYTPKNSDLPQAKFVHVSNEISDAMREAIYQHIRTAWGGGETLPATYAEGRNERFNDTYVQDFVYRLFVGEWTKTFWESRKKQAA
jgi:hypothetical protein